MNDITDLAQMLGLVDGNSGEETRLISNYRAFTQGQGASECIQAIMKKLTMSVVWNKYRNSLHIETVEKILFVKNNGPNTSNFDPSGFVKSWLKKHPGPLDMRKKQSKKKSNGVDDADVEKFNIFC